MYWEIFVASDWLGIDVVMMRMIFADGIFAYMIDVIIGAKKETR